MKINWYRVLFSIDLSYKTGTEKIKTGIMLVPSHSTLGHLSNAGHSTKSKDGEIKLVYEAVQTGNDNDPLNIPGQIEEGRHLFFKSYFLPSHVRNDILEAVETDAGNTGFPLLLSGEQLQNGTEVEMKLEAVKIKPSVFEFRVRADETGNQNSKILQLTIKNSNNLIVYDDHIKVDDQAEFARTIDLTLFEPDIYTFSIGSYTEKLFVDTRDQLSDCQVIVQIRKSGKLKYKPDLADKTFTKFHYAFEN